MQYHILLLFCFFFLYLFILYFFYFAFFLFDGKGFYVCQAGVEKVVGNKFEQKMWVNSVVWRTKRTACQKQKYNFVGMEVSTVDAKWRPFLWIGLDCYESLDMVRTSRDQELLDMTKIPYSINQKSLPNYELSPKF